MVESVYDRPLPNRIHLQIGALDTIPKHLTLEIALKAIQTGRCSVTIVEGTPESLLEQLSEHKIDLVITNSHSHLQNRQLYSKRIARLPLWVAGCFHLRPKKKFIKNVFNV